MRCKLVLFDFKIKIADPPKCLALPWLVSKLIKISFKEVFLNIYNEQDLTTCNLFILENYLYLKNLCKQKL